MERGVPKKEWPCYRMCNLQHFMSLHFVSLLTFASSRCTHLVLLRCTLCNKNKKSIRFVLRVGVCVRRRRAKTKIMSIKGSGGRLTVPAGLQEETVHSIPSKTTYSGPARVRSFFQPAADAQQKKLQAAQGATAYGDPQISAFRGRTLRGAEVALPEGFSGENFNSCHGHLCCTVPKVVFLAALPMHMLEERTEQATLSTPWKGIVG